MVGNLRQTQIRAILAPGFWLLFIALYSLLFLGCVCRCEACVLRGDGTLCLTDFGGIVLARAELRQGLRLSDGIHLAPEVRC